MVRVPVEAVRVVGDQHLRAYLPHDLHQQPGRGVHIGAPEGSRVVVRRGAHHAGVPVPSGPAEEPVVGHAHRGAGRLQLGDPVPAELVGLVGGEPGQLRNEDLTLLAEGAGHQGDVCPGGGVVGHGGAGADRLVVRVRVHENHPSGGTRGGGSGVVHVATIRARPDLIKTSKHPSMTFSAGRLPETPPDESRSVDGLSGAGRPHPPIHLWRSPRGDRLRRRHPRRVPALIRTGGSG